MSKARLRSNGQRECALCDTIRQRERREQQKKIKAEKKSEKTRKNE